jgi:hypothetical protein
MTVALKCAATLAMALLLAASAPAAAQSKKARSRGAAKRAPKALNPWPDFTSRHSEWVRRKELAAEAGTTGPDPLLQYLVAEVVVTGVFETDGGYGVFLFATPTGTTFFVAPGASLFNGRLDSIAPGGSGFAEDTQVVFVERAPKGGSERRVVKRVEAPPEKPAAGPVAP